MIRKTLKMSIIAVFLLIFFVCAAKPEEPSLSKPLFQAINRNNVAQVKELIANGADVNAKSNDGVSPLHYAAFKGHKKIAKTLIEKGADVNAKADNGFTPLRVASARKFVELVALRENGAKE